MGLAGLFAFISIIGAIAIASFYRFSSRIWTSLLAALLIVYTYERYFSFTFGLILWVPFVLVALFVHLPKLRQQYLWKPQLLRIKNQIPAISQTEQMALDAGDTWWEKELFSGTPDLNQLYYFPKPVLSNDEQAFLDNEVETLCEMLNDWEVNNTQKDLPKCAWDYLKHHQFFGLVIPKEYGGKGFSAVAHSTIVSKISTRSISAAITTMVPNSLGPAELLIHYGTEQQKSYYLPRLARGEEIPCFALTNPEAGSDAASIPDVGVVCYGEYEGQSTLGIRLSWDKRYITLAPVATVLGLAFHLRDPDHLIGSTTNIGITLCLLPTQHPGVEIGNRHCPMQLAFMNGTTRGTNVFIPLDWIIGGVEKAGAGWRMLMECLSIGRSISLPALATGSAMYVYRTTGAYAKIREQFNRSIGQFEGVAEGLGYIAGFTYLLQSARLMTANAIDQGIKPSTASAIAKYHMTELARLVINHAMDIHAGHGVQMGPRNRLAHFYQAIPISVAVEGANILTRNLIIFGQGAIRCHPYLLKEVALLQSPNVSLEALDETLMAHIGYLSANLICTFVNGLTGGRFISTETSVKAVARYEKQLKRMSLALSLFSDVSLILLGGSLKQKERISARLGDVLSNLYLASSVLKYFHDQNNPDSDVDYVCWCLQYCLYRIQVALNELSDNFPIKVVGKLLLKLTFPFGNAYKLPSDNLHHRLAHSMLRGSELRERLTRPFYHSTDESDLNTRLEKALTQFDTVDTLWKKINKAIKRKEFQSGSNRLETILSALAAGVISESEATELNEYEFLKQEIIAVNEFSHHFDRVIA